MPAACCRLLGGGGDFLCNSVAVPRVLESLRIARAPMQQGLRLCRATPQGAGPPAGTRVGVAEDSAARRASRLFYKIFSTFPVASACPQRLRAGKMLRLASLAPEAWASKLLLAPWETGEAHLALHALPCHTRWESCSFDF